MKKHRHAVMYYIRRSWVEYLDEWTGSLREEEYVSASVNLAYDTFVGSSQCCSSLYVVSDRAATGGKHATRTQICSRNLNNLRVCCSRSNLHLVMVGRGTTPLLAPFPFAREDCCSPGALPYWPTSTAPLARLHSSSSSPFRALIENPPFAPSFSALLEPSGQPQSILLLYRRRKGRPSGWWTRQAQRRRLRTFWRCAGWIFCVWYFLSKR